MLTFVVKLRFQQPCLIPLNKIFAISLPSSHFLTATLDFTSFFTTVFWGCTLFLKLGCFRLDFTFYNCILWSWHIAVINCCLLLFCLLLYIGCSMDWSIYFFALCTWLTFFIFHNHFCGNACTFTKLAKPSNVWFFTPLNSLPDDF